VPCRVPASVLAELSPPQATKRPAEATEEEWLRLLP
jgi:hypothetical protein